MSCLKPYITKQGIPVPCGNCEKCHLTRAKQWSFRLLQQIKVSESAYFITLTYNNEHVPRTKKGFLTLNYPDIQKWIKRVRKNNKWKIKYYLSGEYGGKTKRPHYHVIIFNLDLETFLNKKDYENVKRCAIPLDGKTKMYVKSWKDKKGFFGDITIGKVEEASTMYTLKYISKEKTKKIGFASWDDRAKEKSLMSKGLGENYLSEQIRRYHNDSLEKMYTTSYNGYKVPLSRYYKERLYDSAERQVYAEWLNSKKLEEQTNKDYKTMTKEVKQADLLRNKKYKRKPYDKDSI